MDYYIGRFWNYERTNNVNSPLNGDPNRAAGRSATERECIAVAEQRPGKGERAVFASVGAACMEAAADADRRTVRVELKDDAENNPFLYAAELDLQCGGDGVPDQSACVECVRQRNC